MKTSAAQIALAKILEKAKAHRDMANTDRQQKWWGEIATIAHDSLGKPSLARLQAIAHREIQRERLFVLCRELDIEMDGVRCPGSAAAILNAVRAIVTEDD